MYIETRTIDGYKTELILRDFELSVLEEAKHLVAENIAHLVVKKNIDKFMAEIDLKGMANLIAVHAAKELGKKHE